jgi:hypothetical protein
VSDGDVAGTAIHNEENQNDKLMGISFRRKDQISGDVIWSVLKKVVHSNSSVNALNKLVIVVHSVRMPIGFGGDGTKSKDRPPAVMVHLKRSIVEVKAENNCLARA